MTAPQVFVPSQVTDSQNFLQNSRGVLAIAMVEGLELYCSEFDIPGLSSNPATFDTPFVSLKFQQDKLEFEELRVTFFVREDLSNWMVIYNWLAGLGFPESFEQSRHRDLTYSDATLHLFKNNNTPLGRVKFKNLFPISLGSVRMTTTDSDVSPVTTEITFAYDTFSLEIP